MGMCLNRNVLIGLGVVAAGVLVVAPQAFVAALPVLILLACPLSMVFMMRGVSGSQSAGAQTGGACSTSQSTSPPQDQSAEIARLRAEVDQLRAGVRDRQQAQRTGGAE